MARRTGRVFLTPTLHPARAAQQAARRERSVALGKQSQAPAAGETLKERLSDKASDEQRVNNCKVPADRRGSKPRPEGCGAAETQAARKDAR